MGMLTINLAESKDTNGAFFLVESTDAEQTAHRFSEYGVRFLTVDEVTNELPLFPKPVQTAKSRTEKPVFDTLISNKNQAPSSLKAFQRAESLEPSKWYMGTLMTNLAETEDTNGAFLLVQGTLVPGTEPPPHVHSREYELFYVLDGEFDVYVGEEVFTGQCVFLPKLKPHAVIIRSPRIRLLTLVTPAGLEKVFRDMSKPAKKLEAPSEALTYSQADLNQTVKRFTEYGVRILSPEEAAH